MSHATRLNVTPIKIGDILPDLISKGFIIYAGAGISIPAPSCSPSWWQITEEILRAFFDRVPADWGMPSTIIIKSEIWQPESIFENFAAIFDTHLYKVFNALNVAEPNGNHKIIAKLAKAGVLKACFTTNFDIYIERALRAEGVAFDLIVDNVQYDSLYNSLRNSGLGKKFLLCKIHGTIERPDTIVSVASAYKSAKGFSPPKALVLEYLLGRFPCLFLGYSGWDFEHNNYRKFWEKVGHSLQGIYWNRRVGESGGPQFDQIFSSAIEKFHFTEAELPDGLISPVQKAHISTREIPILTDNDDWNRAQKQRTLFFKEWAEDITDADALAAVINNGVIFAPALQDYLKNLKQNQDEGATWAQEMQTSMAEYTKKITELGTLLSTGAISMEQWQQENNELQERSAYAYLPEKYRAAAKAVIRQNPYPGFTDNSGILMQILPKMRPLFEKGFIAEGILERIIKFLKIEQDAQAVGEKEYIAETTYNTVYLQIVKPGEPIDPWKSQLDQLLLLKTRFLHNEITQTEFTDKSYELQSASIMTSMGFTIPTKELFKRLFTIVASAKSPDELVKLSVPLFLTGRSHSVFLTQLFKSTPYVELRSAAMAPTPNDDLNNYDPTGYFRDIKRLQEEVTKGKISPTAFSKVMSESQQRMMDFQTKPLTEPFEMEITGFHPPLPRTVIEKMDNEIKTLFKGVLDTLKQFPDNQVTFAKILLYLYLIKIWCGCCMGLDILSGTQMQNAMNAGKYPVYTCNPDIYRFLLGEYMPIIEKGFIGLPGRFGQQLCDTVVTLAQLGGDIELCKRATLRSLEYSEGIVTDATPENIPVIYAQMLENRGDNETAFKFYEIALDGIRNATPPTYSDVIVYRSALLTAQKGNLKGALRIIGLFHPNFGGREAYYKANARTYAISLAERLSKQLGYPDLNTAINDCIYGTH